MKEMTGGTVAIHSCNLTTDHVLPSGIAAATSRVGQSAVQRSENKNWQ